MSNQIQMTYNGKSIGRGKDDIAVFPKGYYATPAKFTLFTPGIYTVEGISYFNQTVLEYFTVT
ncbi:hypothetical protein [Acidianus brierleyi]|uniref:hypothetical protein n=1 Tax=Acidianus brierleyi TaxID=41673 RepID=UPI001FE7F953|nr:hypothetical protein [Acidianus brierleyi]